METTFFSTVSHQVSLPFPAWCREQRTGMCIQHHPLPQSVAQGITGLTGEMSLTHYTAPTLSTPFGLSRLMARRLGVGQCVRIGCCHKAGYHNLGVCT